ncbi:MAG: hypothetical protein ACR2LA_05395, partial [Acidimicrobiales bacterium]
EDPDGIVHLEVQRPAPTQEILLRTDDTPGFGWRGLAPADLGDHAVRTEGQGLTNGLVTVIPDQSDGTFAIDGVAGFGRLVDDGDAGDTYNWSPATFDGPIHRPEDVDVLVSEAGPVRGRIEIERRYRWPTHVEGGEDGDGETGRRVGEVAVIVSTVVELRAGEDLVRLSVAFTNPACDHRLRVLLPLPEPAQTSLAECAFGTVERGLEAEGGPNEQPLATYPSRRFVSAGGLLVVHDGTGEYELVDRDVDAAGAARALAVTLLRSVGVISRGPMTMRALPAGPPVPTPGAQMLGPHHVELVLHLGGRDPYAVADEAQPLLTARRRGGTGLGEPDSSGQALAVEGAEVSALTRRPDGRLELRVVETAGQPTTLRVPGRCGELTDLAGRPLGLPFDGELDMEPHRIVTLALDEPLGGAHRR